jgi:hypothetical protein
MPCHVRYPATRDRTTPRCSACVHNNSTLCAKYRVNRAATASIPTHASDVVNSVTASLSCSTSAATSAAHSSALLPFFAGVVLAGVAFAVVSMRRVRLSPGTSPGH